MTVTVTAFYKFVRIDTCEELISALKTKTRDLGIKGTILVAPEGINATVSGEDAAIRAMLAYLRADPRFANLVSKESFAPDHPFRRMKVKRKREIVTIGVAEADPTRQVGTYVKPQDWNELVSRDDVVLIDTRNAYEVDIGTFRGARDPKTRSFREFPAYVRSALDPAKTPKVAMFCTGGIRCEKASSLMLAMGFPEVYHLEGGILKYLETVSPDESLWQGECFVFDERVALEFGVEIGTHMMCKACGYPIAKDADDVQCPKCGAAYSSPGHTTR